MHLLTTIVFMVGPLYSAHLAAQRQDWETVKRVTSNLLYQQTAREMYIAACARTNDYRGIMQAVESAPLDQVGELEIIAHAFAAYKLRDPATDNLLEEALRAAPYLDDFIEYIQMNYDLDQKRLDKAYRIAMKAASRWKRVDRATVFTYAASVTTHHPYDAIKVLKKALTNMPHSDSARAYLMLAKAYSSAGQKVEAVEYYKKVLIRFPDTPYSVEAAKHVRNYRTAKAKAYFFNKKYSAALRYAFSNSDVRLMVYYKKRRYSAFLKRYRHTKKHDARVHLYAARIYKYRGLSVSSRNAYLKAVTSNQEDVARAAIIELTNLIISKRDVIGFNLLKKKLSTPDQFQSFRLGLAAYGLGRKTEAIRFFKKASASDESGFWRSAALFWLYKLTGISKYRVMAKNVKPYSYYTLRAYHGKVPTANPTVWNSFYLRKTTEAKRGKLFALLGYMQWAIDEAKKGGPYSAYEIGRFALSIGDYRLSMEAAGAGVNNANSPLPVEALKIAFPCLYRTHVHRHARIHSVSPYLMLALIREESRFTHDIVSHAGAVGLTQLMPQTAKKIWRKLNPGRKFSSHMLFDPNINIGLGSYHMKQLLAVYKNEIYALAAYNAGKSRVEQWRQKMPFQDADLFVEMIPFEETRNYVRRVMRSYYIYKKVCE